MGNHEKGMHISGDLKTSKVIKVNWHLKPEEEREREAKKD